jgi:hypothetical protein
MAQRINQILKRNGVITVGAALLAVWGLGAPAHAVIITPGQTLSTTGEATPAFGAALYSTGEVPFQADAFDFGDDEFDGPEYFGGDFEANVYADPTTHDLDFVYQFSSNFSGGFITAFSVSSFAGWTTDADYLTGTGTDSNDAPTTVTRDTFSGGSTLSYQYDVTGVVDGDDSAELIVKTNAPISYLDEDDLASFQGNGTGIDTISAPGTVPEPATIAIAGLAACALGLRRRNAAPKAM